MNRWTRVLVAGVIVAAVSALVVPAEAHKDPTKDPKGSNCDTWSRKGHKGKGKGKPASHEHKGSNDQAIGPVYFHNHGGHYVLRGDDGYLEIVGGQGYEQGGNQGGYVQGEFDHGQGLPDMDGHADLFAGQNTPNVAGGICVSIADSKVSSAQNAREPFDDGLSKRKNVG